MSTVERLSFFVSAWTACAVLSARSFIPMLSVAERRSGRSISNVQYAALVIFWPLTWLAIGITFMYALKRDGEDGENE